MKTILCLLLLIGPMFLQAHADDFFNIEGVSFRHSPSEDDPRVTRPQPKLDPDTKQPILDKKGKPVMEQVFVPRAASQV